MPQDPLRERRFPPPPSSRCRGYAAVGTVLFVIQGTLSLFRCTKIPGARSALYSLETPVRAPNLPTPVLTFNWGLPSYLGTYYISRARAEHLRFATPTNVGKERQMTERDDSEFVTAKEAARILDISVKSVQRLCRKGKLASVNPHPGEGNRFQIYRKSVMERALAPRNLGGRPRKRPTEEEGT